MSLPLSVTFIHSLSREVRWLTLAAALSASGCRPAGGLPMEGESSQSPHATDPIFSTVSSGPYVDSTTQLFQHLDLVAAAELAPEPSTAVVGPTATSFTDIPVLLNPRESQTCDEVTVSPGTTRRIPYVIPSGWHYVNNVVYVAQEIPELPDLDFHIGPLSAGIFFRGAPHQGLLLYASVPCMYQNRKRSRWAGAVNYTIKPVTTSLKLILQVHLERLPALRGVGYASVDDSPLGNILNASVPSHNQLPSIAFGTTAWREYFGVEVDEEPRLPDNIVDILNSESPFMLEDESSPQRVGDNHLLTLIPSTVDREGLTLDKLGELVLRNHDNRFAAFQGNSEKQLGYSSHGYHWYSTYLTDANRQTPIGSAPYWVLLPKTILQDSRKKSFSCQEAMVAQYSSRGYQLPRALEVAVSLLAHYAWRDEERLYANENQKGWWTYTRCSDVDKDGDPLMVGGFEVSGLDIDRSRSFDRVDIGVACFRKL